MSVLFVLPWQLTFTDDGDFIVLSTVEIKNEMINPAPKSTQSKHNTLNETKWIVIYVEIQVAVSTKVSYDSISTLVSEVLLSLCKQ